MKTQNITLAVPTNVLLKLKRLAVRRRTSAGDLLIRAVERLVEQEDAYAQAHRRHLECLIPGADTGTRGQVTTGRDEPHDRD
jgi:hypothetical protein